MNTTTIEWTDVSWNPITGCTKVSQGCRNCYAERFYERFHGKGTFRLVHLHPERLKELKALKKPSRIFVNSMSDLFHEDVPYSFIKQVYQAMLSDNRHTYQILTKRPARALHVFYYLKETDGCMYNAIKESKNIWHGVSVENQATANERIPLLMQFPVPVRFLSCEPLLGPIRIADAFAGCFPVGKTFTPAHHIHWVIVGGESGPDARPMHPEWARLIRNNCEYERIPFFFKQWGQYLPFEPDAQPPYYNNAATGEMYDAHWMNFLDEDHNAGRWMGGRWMDPFEAMLFCKDHAAAECMFLSVGKKKAGHLLDGKVYQQFPDLKP